MNDYTKYIEVADAVKVLYHDCIRYVFPTTAEPTTEFIKLDNAINLLRLYPSEDVEPVVRCKDCKWYVRSMIKQDGTLDERYKPDWCDLYRRVREETYFCADGERKDNEID